MVGTMLPIGYGARLRSGTAKPILAYGIGSVGAAAVAGAALGTLGQLLPLASNGRVEVASAIGGFLALAYSLSEASLVRLPLPSPRRQVPLWWYRRFPPSITGLLYGGGLGIGFATRVPIATFYLLPIWMVMSAAPLPSMFIFGMFGFGRFLPLVLIGVDRARDVEGLEVLVKRILETEPLVKLLNGVLLAFVGSYLILGLAW